MPALKRFGQGWLCLAVSTLISIYVVSSEFTITEDFVDLERGFLYKAWYNMMAMQTEIWTFYGGFCFMESLQIASGLGYSEKEVVVLKIENGQ